MLHTPSPILALIVPCYNEEAGLPIASQVLLNYLETIIANGTVSNESFVCFVNDGSRDKTWDYIAKLHEQQPTRCHGINLSRNFNQQSALMAGLFTENADCYVTIDSDLQEDETAISRMVESFKQGHDIVYGIRSNRSSDSMIRKLPALGFYKIMQWLGTKSVYNSSEYRLLSRRAVEELKQYSESNVYLRGLITELGFPVDYVQYDVKAREYGESKYTFFKLLSIAWTAITSFSNKPLRISLYLGIITCCLSIPLAIYTFWQWVAGSTIAGYTTLVLLLLFFGGIQLIMLGIIGEYLGKVFMETKRRPRFIIQEHLA
jgi:glycosyltransferase involved in cell wall biosynthesis